MAGNSPRPADLRERIVAKFNEAKQRFDADTNNAEAGWQFGRACFDLADSAGDRAERAIDAEQGIAACRQAIVRNPASAPAHYYLGMNLGELADTRRNFGALRLVREMEREFLTARDLNAQFDYAGPDRNLGLLYMEAPVFASIGSRRKALLHFRQAVEVAPDYPENRLDLIEACLKWGDTAEARAQFEALEKAWPEARRKLSGSSWDYSWKDWEKRLKAVKHKLEPASKQLEAPHEH